MLDRFRKSEFWCNVLWWFYNPFYSRRSVDNIYVQRASNAILEMDEDEKHSIIRELENNQRSQMRNIYRFTALYMLFMLMTFLFTNNVDIRFNAGGLQFDSLSKLREVIFVLASGIFITIEVQSVKMNISRKILGKIKFGEVHEDIKIIWLNSYYFFIEIFKYTKSISSAGQVLTGFLFALLILPILLSVLIVNVIAYIYFTVELVAIPAFSNELTIFLVGLADTLFLGTLLLSIYVNFPFRRLRPRYQKRLEAITTLGSPRAEAEFWHDLGYREQRAKMFFLRLKGFNLANLGKDELEKRISKIKRRTNALKDFTEWDIRRREKAIRRRRRKERE